MASWFRCDLGSLIEKDALSIADHLAAEAAARRLDPNPESFRAWRTTVELVQQAASQMASKAPQSREWHACFEFELPRRRRRIDAVILTRELVCIFEVKAGATRFDRASMWQVEEYALDLRDFHQGSRDRFILPFVVATSANASPPLSPMPLGDVVAPVQRIVPSEIAGRLIAATQMLEDPSQLALIPEEWDSAAYKPTKSIVEAARQLYEGHDVRDIAASDSHNLDLTVDAVVELVDRCRRQNRKGIAFITGAPGSGKTLAGLQVVHDRRLEHEETASVFLSGNVPLVEVISSALALSERRRTSGRTAEFRRRVSAFVQHAYQFRNEYAEAPQNIPHERIVLFDEAQRAWDSAQVSRKTQGRTTRSEPELMLDIMNRHDGWALIIAMVGEGQEINRGESGLGQWGEALQERHPDWLVAASPEVLDRPPGSAHDSLFTNRPTELEIEPDPRLHLKMNVRSPRAERLNQWVNSVLSFDEHAAAAGVAKQREFPLVMTRSLTEARTWLRDRADEDHRFGLVANSAARRLRAWGLDTNALRIDQGWSHWFLGPRGDVRSSYQMEVPATNFDCQGLELDWVCVCWGNDLVPDRSGRTWLARQFKGSRWQKAGREISRYIVNSYRVLLTRARRGQVIWVPEPDGSDETLKPADFEAIWNYLRDVGVAVLED